MGRNPSPASRAVVAAAWCATALAGCTMCPDPYDYSGPVPNGSAPQNDFRARSNGIAPIGAAPRPWPPVVQKDREAPGDHLMDSPVRVAAATAEPTSELLAAEVVGPVVEHMDEMESEAAAGEEAVGEAVVEEEPVVEDLAPGSQPSTEATGDDPAGEAQTVDVPTTPVLGPAGDGWRPKMFR